MLAAIHLSRMQWKLTILHVEARHGLKTLCESSKVGLLQDLIPNPADAVASDDIGAEIADKAVRVRGGKIETGAKSNGELVLGEGAIKNTSTSGSIRDTKRVRNVVGLDERTVSAHAVLGVKDLPLGHGDI